MQNSSGLQRRKSYTLAKKRVYWTQDEHERFLKVCRCPSCSNFARMTEDGSQALEKYGREWKKVEEIVGTKSSVQVQRRRACNVCTLSPTPAPHGCCCPDSISCAEVFPQGIARGQILRAATSQDPAGNFVRRFIAISRVVFCRISARAQTLLRSFEQTCVLLNMCLGVARTHRYNPPLVCHPSSCFAVGQRFRDIDLLAQAHCLSRC